ncbi:MAG TPA: hypothetical protein VF681_10625 [Abditibacteriaceae bacterium]|jgi:SAM-dependent methyltransferase
MHETPTIPTSSTSLSQPIKSGARRDLFLVSLLILFFELSCIRWFGSTVIFLTFFTNLVLMACFLGMSIGLLTATHRRNFIRATVPLTLLALILAMSTASVFQSFSKINVDVGSQSSPQQIYFGTEYRANDPSQVVIPIELIAGVFFILIAAVFIGLGQEMGRAFNRIPDRLQAYSIDIAGSLSGIVLFGLCSYFQTPPLVWFSASMALVGLLLWSRAQQSEEPTRRVPFAIQTVAVAGVLAVAGITSFVGLPGMQTQWSPYYKINYEATTRGIITNNIGHQGMVKVAEAGPAYSLPHLLNRDAGKPPFKDVLIIGAGSGNDVQGARAYGASHIDGVEIDPVIRALGRANHPDQPYSDPRITIHLDDGRSFLKKSTRQYDLVIYALVDSLMLHSGYSSLRLESFLFTREAMQDVKRRLKPGGVFAMYNFYRQGWVVARLTKLSEEVFGAPPIVISLPYQKEIRFDAPQSGAFTFILAGDTRAIEQSFRKNQNFWLHNEPARNNSINGFTARLPESQAAQENWQRIAPARVGASAATLLPTDDWPFIYLRDRAIPDLNLRGITLVAILSLLLLMAFAPLKASRINWQMFFLGAGFMLLETKGVVHMALLFGATWIVNSFVFGAILCMILLSNLFVLKVRPRVLWPFYLGLFLALLLNVLVPMNTFLALDTTMRVVLSCAVFFVPVFFAGVVFSSVFRDSEQPDVDFGSNVAGIILGGLSEFFSLILGFNNLLVVAVAFYLLSIVFKPRLVPRI